MEAASDLRMAIRAHDQILWFASRDRLDRLIGIHPFAHYS